MCALMMISLLPSRATEDPVLQHALEQAVNGFEGGVGIYARHLASGREAAIRADESFPTASLIKVPLLIAVAARVAAGEVRWTDELRYDPAQINYPTAGGEDFIAKMKPGEMVELQHLAALMLGFSDNHASLWLQDIAGGGAAVNSLLDAKGFGVTRVNSRTAGREKEKEVFGWGMTTPREMAELLVRIAERRLLDPVTDEKMARLLSRSQFDGEGLSAIPARVAVMSKQGAVDRSKSEVLLVHAPGGDYVLCLITKEQADVRWEPDNAGYMLLRRVSRIAWEHFGATARK